MSTLVCRPAILYSCVFGCHQLFPPTYWCPLTLSFLYTSHVRRVEIQTGVCGVDKCSTSLSPFPFLRIPDCKWAHILLNGRFLGDAFRSVGPKSFSYYHLVFYFLSCSQIYSLPRPFRDTHGKSLRQLFISVYNTTFCPWYSLIHGVLSFYWYWVGLDSLGWDRE